METSAKIKTRASNTSVSTVASSSVLNSPEQNFNDNLKVRIKKRDLIELIKPFFFCDLLQSTLTNKNFNKVENEESFTLSRSRDEEMLKETQQTESAVPTKKEKFILKSKF